MNCVDDWAGVALALELGSVCGDSVTDLRSEPIARPVV